MEAKEKAKELFDKYCFAIRTEQTDSGYFTNIIYAKGCALIAVNQILDMDYWDMGEEMFDKHIDYWNEVRNEINKL